MTWQDDIEELQRRKELAYELGGEERIETHHARGRLTVRERLDRLLDAGTFRERGSLAGRTEYTDGELSSFSPSNYVMGTAKINGRTVVVGGDDFTVRGGAADGAVGGKSGHAERMARELKTPIVRLIDGTGGGGSVRTIEDIGRTYIPGNPAWETMVQMLAEVPVVAAAMGSVAGIGAARVAAAHFSVMVKGTSQMFIAGPVVVQRGMGYEMPADRQQANEELGGSHIHVYQSGAVDNEAEDEDDAFRQIQAFLSYLPDNAWQLPPVSECDDPPERRDEELLSIIPKDRRRPYDVRAMLELILDRGSLFEMTRHYGSNQVTAFGRLNGYPIGVLANDPKANGGGLDGPGSDKLTKFVDLCDAFNLPIVNFVDQPGFMLGVTSEASGTIKRGVRALSAIYQATVPWSSVVVRRAFGVAGAGHQNHARWNYRIAWPSGDWGSLPVEGGVMAAYRRDIEAADDPAAYQAEIEEKLNDLRSPFRTAEAFNIEEIIDPRDTRVLLCEWVELVYQSLGTILGPKRRGTRA
ncbi:MAG TPA: carboxyl transferase domain-containing protein [Dehalococcoidia bacterium]|nr:carboxyl transferase domain-containing protein [Dehalococcoidia bacterium]